MQCAKIVQLTSAYKINKNHRESLESNGNNGSLWCFAHSQSYQSYQSSPVLISAINQIAASRVFSDVGQKL